MTESRPEPFDSEPISRLLAVMARLRRECPWTSTQSHESLRQYVIEEAYEVVDAIDSVDSDELKNELGDVLMQVVFHAAIAESDDEGWDFNDVVRAITDKIVQRSPHIFASEHATTATEVDALWRRVKAEQAGATRKPRRTAPLPALALAQKHLDAGGIAPDGDSVAARIIALVAEAQAAGIDSETAVRAKIRELDASV